MRYWATDVAYLAVAILTSIVWGPRMLIRGKFRTDWAGRFGRVPALGPADGHRLLLHAVSVGEVNALRHLVDLLESTPGVEIVISSTTDTGIARARSLYGDRHAVVRYPLDFSWSVRRFLRSVQPSQVGLVELEVWPTFVRSCTEGDIPVSVINGRLSDRSARRYAVIRPFLKSSFARLRHVCVQNIDYRKRFIEMGARAESVEVTGNLKWDNARGSIPGAGDLGRALGLDSTRPVLVAGSTAPEEHALIREAVPEEVQVVVAPRRPEWFDGAASTFHPCRRRSSGQSEGASRFFLLDTIGELSLAYDLADVVLVGRSFGARHGSDPAEPAGLGKPVVFGPSMSDFRETVEALLAGRGARQCSTDELPEVLEGLFRDEDERREVGHRARRTVEERQGASERTVHVLLDHRSITQSPPSS